MKNLMIGSTRGLLLWNLALDPSSGPHKGGCGNCRGVVTIDPTSGQATRELEYYALGHLSRFVRPGAQRIYSSSTAEVPTVAFRNPDGSLTLLAFNAGDAEASINAVAAGTRFRHALPSGAAVTFRFAAR